VDLLTPVILSGGVGTRLWPHSRSSRPKQFVELVGDKSLFQQTLIRVNRKEHRQPIIVCNDQHRFLVAEQAREVGVDPASIILEPFGRNTAPAVAIAALEAIKSNPEAILFVCPSDHWIGDEDTFHSTVDQAITEAVNGKLVTFGIEPDHPNTGYGYIRAQQSGISKVTQFTEKPDLSTAQKYLESDDCYYWNSGIFVFRADVYLKELSRFVPEIVRLTDLALKSGVSDMDFTRLDKTYFASCPDISIDYAVMEPTDKAVVVQMGGNWSDLGVWSSVRNILEQDSRGNAIQGDARTVDCDNCLLQSSGRLVTAVGCENLAIVESSDAVMVVNLDSDQSVKDLVTSLIADNRKEAGENPRVYRPWGDYEGLDQGDRYQVKRLVVKPGARLSLQKHHHRAEHWVVVRGTAVITRGEETFTLTENQSTYIPLGELHRLENPGSIDLELIEVQSGSYLGEDDIVRFDDIYGRLPKEQNLIES